MQPSSLVFLVIIAVWAAYFVQYWVRRREHLATARSVDQFSEAMRVLERRSPLPASNLSTPQPRSYAVTPARVARPQVLVKRAEPASAPRPGVSGAAEDAGAPASPAATTDRTPPPARASAAPARRARAVVMLGALATLVVTVPLVVLSVVPLPTLLVPVVALGAAVVWARSVAAAERRARHAARRASRPASSKSSQARSSRQQPGRSVPARPAGEASQEAAHVSVPDASVDSAEPVQPAKPVKPELFDVQAPTERVEIAEAVAPEAVSAPARPLVDEDDIPLTWDPVPVPRPTYAMKSRVTRPAPTSADLVGDADTEYAAYDEIPERRVAGA